MSFEDMMSRFKSQSEEKMADLDHETSNRRGGGYAPRGRRGGGNGGGR
jgi:S1 RNA binding domain protein